MITLNKYITITRYTDGSSTMGSRPRIVCNNGNTLSIQAGAFAYCTPQVDNTDEYTAFEVGFPINKKGLEVTHKLLNKYRSGDGVYGHVPKDFCEKIIKEWGGIDLTITLEMARVTHNTFDYMLDKLESALKLQNYIDNL